MQRSKLLVEKSFDCFIPHAFDAPVKGVTVEILSWRLVWRNWGKNSEHLFIHFDRTHECDRRMDTSDRHCKTASAAFMHSIEQQKFCTSRYCIL